MSIIYQIPSETVVLPVLRGALPALRAFLPVLRAALLVLFFSQEYIIISKTQHLVTLNLVFFL